MKTSELFAQTTEDLKKAIVSFKKKYPQTRSNQYPPELLTLFEKCIAVRGDGYCMDEKNERKKTAKLVYNLLNSLSK